MNRKILQSVASLSLAGSLLASALGVAPAAAASASDIRLTNVSVTEAGPPVATIHTVQRGDTLYGIARRYGTTVSALMQINVLRSTTIYVGQRLLIPAAQPAPQPGPGQVYVVRRGDTLYSLARRFGTTVRAIMQANGLRSSTIYVGQRLVIPGSQAPISQPTLSITPTSGPSSTRLTVTLRGFPANTLVTIASGPEYSEWTEISRAMTDASGSATVPLQNPIGYAPGNVVLIGAAVAGGETVTARFLVTE